MNIKINGRLWNTMLLPAQYYLIQEKLIQGFWNSWVKCKWEKDVLQSLKSTSLHRLLINYKEENGDLTWHTSPYQNVHDQKRMDWHQVFLVIHWARHNYSMAFLPEMLDLILRTQEKVILRDILWNNKDVVQNFSVMKGKPSWGTSPC